MNNLVFVLFLCIPGNGEKALKQRLHISENIILQLTEGIKYRTFFLVSGMVGNAGETYNRLMTLVFLKSWKGP